MKKSNLFIALCAVMFVQPVNSATIVSTVTNGNSVVDTGSVAGDSSFYVDFFNQNSVQINFDNIDNSIYPQDNIVMYIYNSTGTGWSGFTFELIGVGFSGPLNTTPETGTLVSFMDFGNDPDPNSNLATGAIIGLNPFEDTALLNTFGVINTSYSSTYSLILTPSIVPVPAAAWLFGSGLLGLVGVARRRRIDGL